MLHGVIMLKCFVCQCQAIYSPFQLFNTFKLRLQSALGLSVQTILPYNSKKVKLISVQKL